MADALTTNDSNLKITTAGKIFIGITGNFCQIIKNLQCNLTPEPFLAGGIAVGLTVVCAPFVSPALRKVCLPYVPATTQQIKNVFQALTNQKGSLIDLGSGDGRIVIGNKALILTNSGGKWVNNKHSRSRKTRFLRSRNRIEPMVGALFTNRRF